MAHWYTKFKVLFLRITFLWGLAGVSEAVLQNDSCMAAVLDSLVGISSSTALDGFVCMDATSSSAAVRRAFSDQRCLMDVNSTIQVSGLPSALSNSSSSITLAWMQCPSWANGLVAEWLANYTNALKSLGRYKFEIIIQPPPPRNVSNADDVRRVNLEVAGGAGGASGMNLAFSADASTEELELQAATTEDFEHLPETSCAFDPHPLGPLHPRTFLLMWYRADTLAALGFTSPPDHWEGLVDLLAAHKNASNMRSSLSTADVMPKYGLCITDNPHCGRAGDVLAAVAASVVQSRGTSQGYIFNLTVEPPEAEPLVNGSGWRYAAELVQQMLSYNAPDNGTAWLAGTLSPARAESLDCHAVSPYFTAGSCMVTLEWDAALPDMAAAAPLKQPGVLGVAPLPGSRKVTSTATSADDLVPCDAKICEVSVFHDFLYGMYGAYNKTQEISSGGNVLVPAPWPPGHNVSRDVQGALALIEAAAVGQLGFSELAGAAASAVNRAPFSSFFRENTEINYGGIVDAGGDVTDLEVALDAPRMNVLERRLIRQAAADRLRGGMGWVRRRTPSNASACDQYIRTPWWRMALRMQWTQVVNSSLNESVSANSTTMAAGGATMEDAAVAAAMAILQNNGIPQGLIMPYLRALWHSLHSPNAAPAVVAPAEPNWFRWALGHAASRLGAAAAAGSIAAVSSGSDGGGGSSASAVAQNSSASNISSGSSGSGGDGTVTAAVADAAIDTALELMDKYFRLVTSVLDASVVRSRYEASISAADWSGIHRDKDERRGMALSGGALVGVIVGCQVVLVLLLSATAWFVWHHRARRHRDLLGRVRAPQAGPDTTLLITDVQNSTALWEALSVATMDAALQLHHACVRQLLDEYDGYESATEGDSFIVAFASPASATAFAVSCQLALLEADWPQELLQHPDGALVVVDPRATGRWSATVTAAATTAGVMSEISANGRASLHASAALSAAGAATPRFFQWEVGSTGGKLLRGISSAIARSVSVTSLAEATATAPPLSSRVPWGRRVPAFSGASAASAATVGKAPRLPVNAPLHPNILPVSLPTAAPIAAALLASAAEDAESYSRKPTVGNCTDSASPRMSLEGGSRFGAMAAAAAAGAPLPLPLPSPLGGRPVSSSRVRSEVALTLSQSHQVQDQRLRHSSQMYLRPIPLTSPLQKQQSQQQSQQQQQQQQQQQSQQQGSQQPVPSMIRDGYTSCPGTQGALGSAPFDDILSRGAGGYESGGGGGSCGGGGGGGDMPDHSVGFATTSIFSGLLSTAMATTTATAAAARSMPYRDALATALPVSWLPVLPSRGAAIVQSSRSRPYVRLADGRIVAFRGLRVRMGLHSGLSDAHGVSFNKVAASYQYSGEFAEMTRLVSDSAPGGLVVMSGPAFARLRHCVEQGGWGGGGGGGSNGAQKGGGGSRSSIAMKEIKVIYAGHHLLKTPADGAASPINVGTPIAELATASGSGLRSAGLSQESKESSSSPGMDAVSQVSKAAPWLTVTGFAVGGGSGGGGAMDSSVLMDSRMVDGDAVTELNFESDTILAGGWAVGATDSRQVELVPLAEDVAVCGDGGDDGGGGGGEEAGPQRRRQQRGEQGTVPQSSEMAAAKGMDDDSAIAGTANAQQPQQPLQHNVGGMGKGQERPGHGSDGQGSQQDQVTVVYMTPGGGGSSGKKAAAHGLWPPLSEDVHSQPRLPPQQHSRMCKPLMPNDGRYSFDADFACMASSRRPVPLPPFTRQPSLQLSRSQAVTLCRCPSAHPSMRPESIGGGATTAAALAASGCGPSLGNQHDAQSLVDSLPQSPLHNNRYRQEYQTSQDDPVLRYVITPTPTPTPTPLLPPPTTAVQLLQSPATRHHSKTRCSEQQPCQAPQDLLISPPPPAVPQQQPQSKQDLLTLPQALYVAVPSGLLCRLALVPPLRSCRMSQLSSLDAPTGVITVAFLKVVGAATLLAELPGGVAAEALEQCQRLVVGLLGAAGGYLVEGCGDGLVLSAFGSPTTAVEWALDCVEGLRRLDWDPRLLAHELCEEVISFAPQSGLMIAGTAPGTATGQQITSIAPTVASGPDKGPSSAIAAVAGRFLGGWGPGAGGSSTGVAAPLSLNQQGSKERRTAGPPVLSRGLRIKVGIDLGTSSCDLNPGSGRLTYRGRVMNRASRIAGIAAAGQVLVSGAVWEEVVAAASTPAPYDGGPRPPSAIAALSLGPVNLKGVKEPLEVLQCFFHN